MIVVKNPQVLKEILKNEKRQIKLTKEELGCSEKYLSSIITGTRNPSEKIAIKICELTGRKFDDIFFIRNVHKKITE